MDQNEIREPHSKASIEKNRSEKSRISDVSKRSEDGHPEIKIITHIDDFEALEQQWKELAEKSYTHIFQTYEWNRIWWKHFGKNKKLHIVAIYTGNKLVGIAPLFEDDVTLLGRKVYSCLRFLGSYVSQPEGEPLIGCIPYSDYLDCIVHPGYEQLFYLLIIHHFNEVNSVIDESILDEVSEESTIRNTMIPLLAMSNCGLSYKIKQASTSPVILLDSTWEEYLNSMNVKGRYNARRYYNRSRQGNTKAFNIERIKHAEELPGVLTDLMRMHQQQWNNRGFPGTFSEERMRDFVMEIAKSFYKKNWIQFNMAVPVESNENYVAIDALITYKNRVYLMHRCMDEESSYRKHGPGNVLLYAKINEAINEGVKAFELLRGTEKFKYRVSTYINDNKKIIIYNNYKNIRLIPLAVKGYMNIYSHVRIEILQFKLAINGKKFFKGLVDYIGYLLSRVNHASYK